jgi:hypothetical protein
MRLKNTRWTCPHCLAEGWQTGREQVSPRYDHDTVHGKRCRKAEQEQPSAKQCSRPEIIS